MRTGNFGYFTGWELAVTLISIITVAAFDAPRLSRTLSSVSRILSEDIEQIVVYPQVDEISKHLVDSFSSKNPNLKSFNDSGKGIYPAMNLGLSYANGLYCWFINCGDEVLEENIPDLLIFLNKSNPIWVIGQGVFNWREPQIMTPSNLRNFLNFSNSAFISHQTVIARVRDVMTLGGFDTKFKVAADTYLISRLAKSSTPQWFMKNIAKVEKPYFASKNNRLARIESLKLAIRSRDLLSILHIVSRELLNIIRRVRRETF